MKTLTCVIVALTFVSNADAALSKEYTGFAKGPVQFLLTKQESSEWALVQTDEQAKAFIEKFWARRDPTPGTPQNEFLDGFNERMKIADERFHAPGVIGSTTDRGKVFAVLGGPTRLRRSQPVPTSTIQSPDRSRFDERDTTSKPVQGYSPKEIWEYEQAKVSIDLGQPLVEIVFIDQYGTSDWKLERQPKTDLNALFERVSRSYLVPEAPAAAAKQFSNDALRAAIDEIRSGKAAVSPNLHVTVGEFITAAGEDFVPVQLYLPNAAKEAGANVTFFGEIEKDGKMVSLFEEPATLVASNDAAYVARSLSLAPGTYRGTFGIAREGQAPAIISAPITVAGLDKDAPAASPLILSNHVHALTEAQAPTDPYTFGGLRVVPKSDRTFRRSDELWYFVELRNPALDPASNTPKLSVKLSLTGKAADGSAVRMVTPAEDTPAQELKGVPRHWAVGQSISLETLKAGEYTLAVKVTDGIANRTFDLSGEFRIAE